MKKRSKLLALFLACSMVVGALAGCGKGTPSQGDTNQGTAENDGAETEGQEPSTEQEGNGEEVVVTIFHHIGEQSGRDALDAIIAKLEADNPGVKYEAQGLDFSQYGSMLKTKIAGGDAPDIIMGRPKVYSDLIAAGHIMDLSDQEFVGSRTDEIMASMKVDGKIYSVPMGLAGMGIFYNREVFEQCGVEVPKTHEDLMAAADKFVAEGIVPFAHGFKEGWTSQCEIQSDLYGYPLQQNPKMFVDIQNGDKKFADYPEFRECCERTAERLAYESGDDFGTDAAKARAMLINGEAAMFVGGNWDISEFITNGVDDKIGFFATPNTDDDKPILGLAPDGCFMVYSKTEHPEEALKFMEFWSTPEAFEIWNTAGGNIPCALDIDTSTLSPLVADWVNIAKEGSIYNYEAEDVFIGQFDSEFRAWQEEFAADSERDIDAYIQKLDDTLAAIK